MFSVCTKEIGLTNKVCFFTFLLAIRDYLRGVTSHKRLSQNESSEVLQQQIRGREPLEQRISQRTFSQLIIVDMGNTHTHSQPVTSCTWRTDWLYIRHSPFSTWCGKLPSISKCELRILDHVVTVYKSVEKIKHFITSVHNKWWHIQSFSIIP